MVRIRLRLVRLEHLQILLCARTVSCYVCVARLGGRSARARGGIRCVVCGELGREVGGQRGWLGLGGGAESLHDADVRVGGLGVREKAGI